MVRALKFLSPVAVPDARLAATLALLAASDALLRAAARLHKKTVAPAPQREFETLELNGREVGAVFEDGRLVGVVPGVRRL